MGARGPVPNRSGDLARPRERKGSEHKTATKGVARPATIPDADPNWHPIAARLWDAILESGQADFYESSDYAIAYSIMDDLSLYKSKDFRSGNMLQVIMATLSSLLLTEGERRRVGLELEAPSSGEDPSADGVMSGYEEGLATVTRIH